MTRLRAWAAGIAILLLAPVYYIAWQAPALGMYHDDAVYVVTAKSLAEGRGYQLLNLPEPAPQTKYPILFPFALSLIWRINPAFPGNVAALKLLPLAAGIIFLVAAYHLIRKYTGSSQYAALSALAIAAAPKTIFFATTALSETTFAALAMLGLAALVRESGMPRLVAGCLLIAGAYHTRSVGAALMLALLLTLAVRRKPRQFFAALAILFALAVPWVVWQASAHATDLGWYSHRNYYSEFNVLASTFQWPDKLDVVFTNVLHVAAAPALLLSAPANIAAFIVSAALWLLCLREALRARFSDLLVNFLLCYVAMLLIWAWPPERFVFPILPVVFAVSYRGLGRMSGARLSWGIPAAGLIFSLLALPAYVADVRSSGDSRAKGSSSSDEWQGHQALFEWIRRNTESGDVIQANLDPTVYLYTGRKAVRGFMTRPLDVFYNDRPEIGVGSAAEFQAALQRDGVKWVLDAPASGFGEAPALRRLIADTGICVPAAASFLDGRFRVCSVRK